MMHGYRYRSLFWPVVLIGVGVIWLLANLNVIPAGGLWILARFWPLLLVWIGLDILLGHRSALWGAGIGIVAVGVAVLLAVGGPSWGWESGGISRELYVERFSEPKGQATSAEIFLDLSNAPTTLKQTEEPGTLIDATIAHRGQVHFTVSGDVRRRVEMAYTGSGGGWSGNWGWEGGDERWDISLGGGIPIDLELDLSSGWTRGDLTGLDLQSLTVRASSGSVELQLPSGSDRPYPVKWEASSGAARVDVADEADLEMEIRMRSGSYTLHMGRNVDAVVTVNGSSGRFTLDVPDGAALQVDVRDSSSGSVKMPGDMVEVRRGHDDEGLWQTPGFDQAHHKVRVVVARMSSGSIVIE
ncbi:MAG: DUF4097 domain-containing protein [Actinobacteria bacterium]|nr:DUF4097 domain-containing protein [Actinomycetota bacterium]